MYTEDEQRSGIPIKAFILSLILIIIFILLLMWLLPIPKNSNNDNNNNNNNNNNGVQNVEYPNITGLTNRIFIENITGMKDAATAYFTTDKLPAKVGDSVTLTLQEMLDKHLVLPFTDKNGNSCDNNKSYVTLTKLNDSYEMKVNLKCGDEENYIIVPMGCYSYCTSGVCEDKNKKTEPVIIPSTKPSCELYVKSGTLGSNGQYTSNIEIGFKTKTARTSGATIKAYGLAANSSQTFNGLNSYTVKSKGTTTVYGYVKDSNGYVGVCSITVTRKTEQPEKVSTPSCALEVISGEVGTNGWYTSNVAVGFVSKTSTNGATIKSFGLGTSENYSNNSTYVVNKNGSTTVYGYVKDSNGNTAKCNLTVKKDSVRPTCDLTVLSGTKGSNGLYISDVVVGFASQVDEISGISNYGLSNSKVAIYNRLTKYTINKDGNHTIYGYVIDKAGNTGICDINISRQEKKVDSTPSCTLEVTNGQLGNYGWYVGDVTVSFKSKTSTNGATITSYGLGLTENYSNNSSYVITTDSKKNVVNGYVKDSNGNTATCSIEVKKDAVKPTCELKVVSGTYNSKGYYVSDVVVGFANAYDSVSGLFTYGLGLSENYNKDVTYTITQNGSSIVYGYVKDLAGNTNICSIRIEKKDAIEYEYQKKIDNQYGEWSSWQTLTYNPSNPPKFGKYALIEMVDLGKTTEIDYYKQTTGEPFYQYKTVKVGTTTQTYCSDYTYYRDKKTQQTVAVKTGTEWKFAGMVTTTGWPTSTMSVKYEFVGYDWKCTGCELTPKKIWNKYVRTTYKVTTTGEVTTTTGVRAECTKKETKTIEIFDTVKVFVDYEIKRTPVYKDVYRYKKRTRKLVKEAYVDYKWSYYDDKSLLDAGYTYTGSTRTIG